MASTKENICEAAKRLFNEKGYYNVSLREIAESAGTTIGNLTYHFPQKEELILAIQDRLYTDFLHNFIFNDKCDEEDDGLSILKKMLQSFTAIYDNKRKNEFYYKNIVEFSNESKVFFENTQKFRLQVYRYYQKNLFKLRTLGIMRQDISEERYLSLNYVISYLSYIWIENTTPYYDEDIPRIELHAGLKNLIYPYFTPEGVRMFHDIEYA